MLLTFFSFSWQYCTFILANYLLFKTSHLTRWWICYAVVLVLLGGSGFERSSTGASMWRVCVQSPVIVQHRWRRHPHFFYCTLQKKKTTTKISKGNIPICRRWSSWWSRAPEPEPPRPRTWTQTAAAHTCSLCYSSNRWRPFTNYWMNYEIHIFKDYSFKNVMGVRQNPYISKIYIFQDFLKRCRFELLNIVLSKFSNYCQDFF